jgi:hypothetical protein
MTSSDNRVHKQTTDASTKRGTASLQQYLAPTTRTVTSTPGQVTDAGTQTATDTQTRTSANANVRETRSTQGVGKTQVQLEDKGVSLKFRIPFQQRNPVARQQP